MIPDRDYYEDAHGKLTTDAKKAVAQVAVKGHFLDERIAHRFGITDTLVSVDEPNAPRRVTGRNESSVQIRKADEEKQEPQEPAEAAEPKAEEPKSAAKKGDKKK
jgi:hypothetical protein